MPRTEVLRLSDGADGGSLHAAQPLTEVITRLRRALRASIRTDYPWETLPMAQVEVLQTLRDLSSSRVNDLAAALHLAPSTVSGLLGQTMGAGLVERATDVADRRVARFRLTVEGAGKLSDWQRAYEQRIGSAHEALTPEQQSAIIAALPVLSELVDQLAIARVQSG